MQFSKTPKDSKNIIILTKRHLAA